MRTKVYFEERVKVIPLDMNALHDETENGLSDLVRMMTGGFDDVLFENIFNPAVDDTVNIKITIPNQWFTLDGVPGEIPVQTVTLGPSAVPDHFRVFFVIRRNDSISNRDRYQIVGPAIQVVTEPVITRKVTVTRVETTASGNPLIAPGPPILAPSDLGYIEYASVVWDGVTPTSSHNISAIYTFPGYAAGVGPHAGSHLSTGGDPLPWAGFGGPLGSTEGLVPPGAYVTIRGSIQSIGVDVASPYLVVTTTGDNAPGGTAKTASLRVRHNSSLAVVPSGGVDYLGLNFTTGPFAGTSNRPARANHRHSPDETPVAVDVVKLSAGIGDLGKLITAPTFNAVGLIIAAQVYWAPPGLAPPYPMFECGWFRHQLGTVGAKPIIAAANVVKIELGGLSFVELTADALAAALVAVGGVPTWLYSGSEAFPTTGDLYLRIVGSR